MKERISLLIFLALIVVHFSFGQNKQQTPVNTVNSAEAKWTTNAFENLDFVQNVGQFDEQILAVSEEKPFYMADLGMIHAFFTKTGVVYRSEVFFRKKNADGTEIKLERRAKGTTCFFVQEWENVSEQLSILAEEETSNFYSYANGDKQTFKAKAFKKITYKNLYQGIDAEYIFPKGKPGIKYNLIIHPGADVSQIKMEYKNATSVSLNKNGDVVIQTLLGEFTDHAPETFYDDGNKINSNYIISENKMSFQLKNVDSKKTIIIDPWTTNPNMANPGWGPNTNSAYDVDYDMNGNVYVYGSYYPFQLVKLNSAGVIQWTFTVPFFLSLPAGTFSSNYGDFAVDRVTGTCYLVEGVGTGTGGGARAIKVNSSGSLVGIFSGDPQLLEMWRVAYDQCSNTIIVAGGGNTVTNQACVLDTNMTSIVPVNVLGATQGFHDMSLVAVDPAGGTCYMASNKSNVYGSSHDNVLLKLPVPALSPTAYQVYDGYPMKEAYINAYVLGVGSIANPNSFTNGFNGMVASPNWLYMSNGTYMTKFNKNTGASVSSTAIYSWPFFLSQDSIRWGGLDVDECETIYAAVANSIKVYDAGFSLLQTINTTDTIYDLKLGGNNILYACGKNFVSSIDVTTGNVVNFSVSHVNPAPCTCDGIATANFSMTCGDTTNIQYSWSTVPVQTTQTATGLCAGTYTVTVSFPSNCNKFYIDTVTLFSASGGLTVTATALTNNNCGGGTNGSAVANVTGGSGPYIYLWSNGQIGSSATGLASNSYTVTVTDGTGCSSSSTVTITSSVGPSVVITSQTNVTCNGGNDGSAIALASGGSGLLNYIWSTVPVQTSSNAINLTATNYSVTVTDSAGCTATTSVIITEPPVLVLAINNGTGGLCAGQSILLQSNVSGGTSPYFYAWDGGQITDNITVSPITNTTYTLIVTDANGCTITSNTLVTVGTSPSVSFIADNTAFCGNACVNFLSTSIGAVSYNWNFGDGGTSTLANPNYCYSSQGDYTVSVTVTSAGGCTSVYSLPNYIHVYPIPVADFSASTTQATMFNSTIYFTDESIGANSWSWNFGDGMNGTSSNQNPSYTYPDIGTYTTLLIVSNIYGCLDTASIQISITDEFQFYVPNAFTPNGDGTNNTFQGYGVGIAEYQMEIYDRWGMMIYTTDDYNRPWDGTTRWSSTIVQQDVYVYKINVLDIFDKKHFYLGSVTVVK